MNISIHYVTNFQCGGKMIEEAKKILKAFLLKKKTHLNNF